MISHYYALEKEHSRTVVHFSFLFLFSLILAFSHRTLYEILHIPKHFFHCPIKTNKQKTSGYSYTLVKEKVNILNV